MRTSKEMAGEVWRRVDASARGEAARRKNAYAVLSVAACLAVVVGLSFAMPYFSAKGGASVAGRPTVATLFSEGGGAGGYVLVAVLAFALGAAATVICVRIRKKG